MLVPLNRLYHYIQNIAQTIHGDAVVIYRFWPNGSKNIQDLNPLNDQLSWINTMINVKIWCNDQEPLDHEYYRVQLRKPKTTKWIDLLKSINCWPPIKNLNYKKNVFEKNLLLHSERRSHNLKKYQDDNELIPVYYWSHAIIARDWYRYAECETFKKQAKKLFLIYNRAWSGTREYRLRFADLLIENNLLEHCQTTCNVVDPELNMHYISYNFKKSWCRPKNILENFLPPTGADANNSADFHTADYNSTHIEVILETLFDDDRLHLTEKSLRPIACGQPFILAGTQGSLEYLRSYGFKTFDSVWDESYDLIQDPEKRLENIVDLMKQIADWDQQTRHHRLSQLQVIADFNRKWFFSQDFFNLISNELKKNLKSAFDELKSCNNYKPWIDNWTHLMTYPEIIDFITTNQNTDLPILSEVELAMQMCQTRLSN